MHTIEPNEIAGLLASYLGEAAVPDQLFQQLAIYLDLLVKWNGRTNLTAIREPKEMVRRHFGESLFAGLQIPSKAKTLLDFGSGAGFPGLPIQLLQPKLSIVLAESQGKKASFLREAVRALGLTTEVWAERVEAMPQARRFDAVALRAVDKMELALAEARIRVVAGGVLMVFSSGETEGIPIPRTRSGTLHMSWL